VYNPSTMTRTGAHSPARDHEGEHTIEEIRKPKTTIKGAREPLKSREEKEKSDHQTTHRAPRELESPPARIDRAFQIPGPISGALKATAIAAAAPILEKYWRKRTIAREGAVAQTATRRREMSEKNARIRFRACRGGTRGSDSGTGAVGELAFVLKCRKGQQGALREKDDVLQVCAVSLRSLAFSHDLAGGGGKIGRPQGKIY